MSMIYVNMTDTALSGWGLAPNRSHLCVACDTWEQAAAIQRAAAERPDMVRITTSRRPRRQRPGDHVRIIHFLELGAAWHRHYVSESPP
jgi:hypothetical protein